MGAVMAEPTCDCGHPRDQHIWDTPNFVEYTSCGVEGCDCEFFDGVKAVPMTKVED